MFNLIRSPEPCVPSNVSSQLMCSDGIAQVSWAHSANAVSYDVRATTSGQTLTCKSSSPNCTLSDLICGQEYEIHVAATDGTCVSNYSAPFRQGQGTGATFDVVLPHVFTVLAFVWITLFLCKTTKVYFQSTIHYTNTIDFVNIHFPLR